MSWLLKNVYHDAVSGWLMIASLFYKTKQYRNALDIIKYSLSKCTHEKLFRCRTLSDIQYKTLKLQSFQKQSFESMQKVMFIDTVLFPKKSTLLPDELQMVGSNDTHYFPSTAYAYFLNFLCDHHLNNFTQCNDSLQVLELVAKELYLIGDNCSITGAFTMCGYAYLLSGNKKYARHVLLYCVEKLPAKPYNNTAKTLLAMC